MVKDWTWARVKYALAERHKTLADIASKNGLSRTYLSSIQRCQRVSAQKLIADALEIPPQEIWPSRYRADGTPLTGWRVLQQLQATKTANRCLVDKTPANSHRYAKHG